jgi:hypothetical protein
MSIQSEIIDCLEDLEGDLGESITTAANAVIPCVPSMEGISAEIAIGPQVEGNLVQVRVRKSYFVTADNTLITVDSDELLADNSTKRPHTGVKLTYRGKVYRCLKYEEDPSGAYFKLYLGSAK